MSEFSLIRRYCQGIGADLPETTLSVGDDAALISIPPGMELAVSTDSMVEGVHFFADISAADLAQKLLAVNLSDMAAMGADPKWATLAATIPAIDEIWAADFFESLDSAAKAAGVQLIGGDTTQGPLVLSMQIMGLVPQGRALTRSAATEGDAIYVSGTLGDAALALHYMRDGGMTREQLDEQLVRALERPQAQVRLGQGLLDKASACIDISDGLLADLDHIAVVSEHAIEIDIDLLPLSKPYLAYVEEGGSHNLALTGGDDYQLAFSVSSSKEEEIAELGISLDMQLTKIGRVFSGDSGESQPHKVRLVRNSEAYTLESQPGYQHFSEEGLK